MRAHRLEALLISGVMLAAAALVAPAASASAPPRVASHAAPTGSWHPTTVLAGTMGLNLGGDAGVDAVSCPTPGNCSAGGYYNDKSDHYQAFVANEVNGVWHPAIAIPGTAAKNVGGDAETYFLSCPSPGNCGAGGYYKDAVGHYQGFVVNSVNGVWHSAIEAPGTAALNAGTYAAIEWGTCSSVGACAAGGTYTDNQGHRQIFVINEVHGTWHNAVELPGSAALNVGGAAYLYGFACASAGNCSLGGSYKDAGGAAQALVDNEVGGTWQLAQQVPGISALDAGAGSTFGSETTWVSCPSPGNCTAGGHYADTPTTHQAFVVDEIGGTWQSAIELPGSAALNAGGDAEVWALSCATPHNCVASGFAKSSPTARQSIVASEVKGTWHSAIVLPGSGTLNKGNNSQALSVSCWKAGDCAVAGSYVDAANKFQAMVATMVNGVWRGAIEAPGAAGLNRHGDASLYNVTCIAAGVCVAGGYVDDTAGNYQAVIDSYLPPAPTITAIAPAAGTHRGGETVVVHGVNLIGAMSVVFGARPGTHVVVLNAGAIRVTAPRGTGTVIVRVTGPGGTSAVTSKSRFRYV